MGKGVRSLALSLVVDVPHLDLLIVGGRQKKVTSTREELDRLNKVGVASPSG